MKTHEKEREGKGGRQGGRVFTVCGSLDDSRQIQQLDGGTLVLRGEGRRVSAGSKQERNAGAANNEERGVWAYPHHAWDASECCELISSHGRGSLQGEQVRRGGIEGTRNEAPLCTCSEEWTCRQTGSQS